MYKNLNLRLTGFFNELKNCDDIDMSHFAVIDKNDTLFKFVKYPYSHDSYSKTVFSITKSITSLAIGILYDEHKISLDDYVTKYIDLSSYKINPAVNRIKVKHLLTMTSGLEKESVIEMKKELDWVKLFFEKNQLFEPGSYYQYSSLSTHMLSVIITNITQKKLKDFVREKIFEPMDILSDQWFKTKDYTFGGFGLAIAFDDLIKVGKLMLNQGEFNGKRIVSKEYIKMASSIQTLKQSYFGLPNTDYIGRAYGLSFHIMPNGTYRMDGAFGQIVYMIPKYDIGIIVMSESINFERMFYLFDKYFVNEYDEKLNLEMNEVLDIFNVKYDIKPTYKLPLGEYQFTNNTLNLKKIIINEKEVLIKDEFDQISKFELNFEKDTFGESYFVRSYDWMKLKHNLQTYFIDENTLVLKVRYLETPYIVTYTLKNENNELKFIFDVNVNFYYQKFTTTLKK